MTLRHFTLRPLDSSALIAIMLTLGATPASAEDAIAGIVTSAAGRA